MKRIVWTAVVVLLLAALAAPTDAQQPRLPLRTRPATPAMSATNATTPAIPALVQVHARLHAKHQKDKKKSSTPPKISIPYRSFDWTALGIGRRVYDQGQWGTCWAHAGVAALESSVEILSDTFPYLAVQPILDATQDNQGGYVQLVFNELRNTGTGLLLNFPYNPGKLGARPKIALPYRARQWGYVTTPIGVATTAQLKSALLAAGPLYTTIYAGAPSFMNNKGTVMADKGPFPPIDHAVLLVGWDDTKKAWKIKNSWGTSWGAGGFGWVAYGHYRIGTGTAWIQAMVP
jgi:hypothetical protein